MTAATTPRRADLPVGCAAHRRDRSGRDPRPRTCAGSTRSRPAREGRARRARCRAEVVSLDPATLNDVIACIKTFVGDATGTNAHAAEFCMAQRARSTRSTTPLGCGSATNVRARVVGPAVQRRPLGRRHDRRHGQRPVLTAQRRNRRLGWDKIAPQATGLRSCSCRVVMDWTPPWPRVHALGRSRSTRSTAATRRRMLLTPRATLSWTGSRPSPARSTRSWSWPAFSPQPLAARS